MRFENIQNEIEIFGWIMKLVFRTELYLIGIVIDICIWNCFISFDIFYFLDISSLLCLFVIQIAVGDAIFKDHTWPSIVRDVSSSRLLWLRPDDALTAVVLRQEAFGSFQRIRSNSIVFAE